MKYQKPSIIAKNLPSGSYAAGCPSKDREYGGCLLFGKKCQACERSA